MRIAILTFFLTVGINSCSDRFEMELPEVEPANVFIDWVEFDELPELDRLGNPWSADNRPDLKLTIENEELREIIYRSEIMHDVHPDSFPFRFVLNPPLYIDSVNYKRDFIIDLRDSGPFKFDEIYNIRTGFPTKPDYNTCIFEPQLGLKYRFQWRRAN